MSTPGGRSGFVMTKATFPINDRWRLSEDGEVQWILQYREGKRWKNKAFCGTRDGLMDVALPHNKVAIVGGVLAALGRLPEHYKPGGLEQLYVKSLDQAA